MIVVSHPNPGSYCKALGKTYLRGAQAGGHVAKLFAQARTTFDPVLREGYHRQQAFEPDLIAAREAFLACEHVVFVFRLWCGDIPAMMKGFIERIM